MGQKQKFNFWLLKIGKIETIELQLAGSVQQTHIMSAAVLT